MKRWIVAVISLTLLLTLVIPAAPSVSAAPTLSSTGRYSMGISPEMELLSGVLAQTSWITNRGPTSGPGNEYFRALQAFFAPYKDHQAVKIAEELTKKGFTFDAPVAFICHLGPLPDLDLKYEYSDYVLQRAGGRQILEDFRLALKDLAAQSQFNTFVTQWQPSYDRWVAGVSGLDGDKVIGWLESFFGSQAGEFHFILAPAMFPGGGYGATVTGQSGDKVVFQIIRENGTSNTEPQFQTGESLQGLATHEWGHSFVNPALAQYSSRVNGLYYLFLPVLAPMAKQAYPSPTTFMNEQVLRAVTSLAAEQTGGQAALEREIVYNEKRGFYLTRPVVAMLRDYLNQRDRYTTFDSFVPTLLNRLNHYVPPQYPWVILITPTGAAVEVLFLAAFLWWRRRRFQRHGSAVK